MPERHGYGKHERKESNTVLSVPSRNEDTHKHLQTGLYSMENLFAAGEVGGKGKVRRKVNSRDMMENGTILKRDGGRGCGGGGGTVRGEIPNNSFHLPEN